MMETRKLANIALLASLAALAGLLIWNIIWVDISAAGTGDRADDTVQDAFYTAGGIVIVALAASTVLWTITHLRRRPLDVDETETEALAGLAHRAGEYLDGLYALLWVAGTYLLLFGFVLVPFGDELGIAYQDIAPNPSFSGWIALVLGTFWTATALIWLVHIIRVGQERRRWRERIRETPLEG